MPTWLPAGCGRELRAVPVFLVPRPRKRRCVVGVTFTNDGGRPRPFTGTADETGPTWRISGYDAQGHEFHGHARPVPDTAPGGTGGTEIVFEVPPEVRLRRVLIATGMVELPSG